ncbi:Transport and Golgi organization protein [Trema orientale]|uniref:Transport and Golgi organization protein n=1 Tax=Trema orientale TaxID=63057 RepID=A0A2P5EWK0_TREOI|nr:Transport and Golgi organization protein [Trema orientale]
MCIAVFLWQAHPLYPFFLLLNRDEYHSRPTEGLAWRKGEEILGGKDGLAGGTWLACGRDGKIAFLTNVRELHLLPQAKTRGDLPLRFLRARSHSIIIPFEFLIVEIVVLRLFEESHGLKWWQSKKTPVEFAEEVVKEADQFNGFNLILADISTKSMVYVTNRTNNDQKFVTNVLPGIHVLTNASLDTPWPKAQRLGDSFKELLKEYSEGELPAKEMVEKLMTNTIRDDDESLLPAIFPPESEHYLSSIFIDAVTPLGRYGTRSTSALAVKTKGEVSFYEKSLDSENEQWNERTVKFEINRGEESNSEP